MTTRDEAFAMFQAAAHAMWRNADNVLGCVEVSDEEPAGGVCASVTHPAGAVRRIGPLLFPTPRAWFRLRVASRLLAQGPDAVRRIMVHEAVHLGISGHGAEFRALCRSHGGAVSEDALLHGDVVRVQQLVRRRYRTVREFRDEAAAVAWGMEQVRANPGERFRVQM